MEELIKIIAKMHSYFPKCEIRIWKKCQVRIWDLGRENISNIRVIVLHVLDITFS